MPDYPIPYHPTWDVLDSTKIREFMTCPRKYFYSYLLGWRTGKANNHLIFGQAWHVALEHLLKTDYSPKSLGEAFDLFVDTYRPEFPEDMDALLAPKNPDYALRALAQYTGKYRTDHEKYETLMTEVSGQVPINDEDHLHFRLDAVLRDRKSGEVFVLEHKTGSRLTHMWSDQWILSVQVGTYTHALRSIFEDSKAKGVMINGTFFMKTKFDFTRIPIWKNDANMNVWLAHTSMWVDAMKFEMTQLAQESPDFEIMSAFPMNVESCQKYFGCQFHDFCCGWANPLLHCDEPPIGFVNYWWDPRDLEKENVFNLK